MAEREELEAALRAHIAAHGEKNWSLVRDRFPDVAERTFWRARARVCSGDVGGQHVEDARRKVAANIAHVAKVREVTDPALEAAGVRPPSRVVGFRDLALLEHAQRALDDIAMLREYALKPEGGIKNPNLFGQQISLSDRLLQTILKIGEAVMDLEFQAEFYDRVTSAIVEELADVPDVQERLIRRLHGLLGAHDGTRLPS
jgi:hypothetical protein